MRWLTWIKVLFALSGLITTLSCNKSNQVTEGTTVQKQPIPTPWSKFGDLNLTSGLLWVGDAQFAPIKADGLIVELPKGHYSAYVQKMDFGSEHPMGAGTRVSRMRVSKKDSIPSLGRRLGKTWADTGTQGVCDYRVYAKAMPKSYDEYWTIAEEALVDFEDTSTFVLNAKTGAKLLWASSGFGDGEFRVFELLDGDVRCGIEIELIGPEE